MVFLAIGLVAGVLSGLFGIGGGVVIVPALIMIAKMSPETATGTSLASLLLPVGALGAWYYYRHGFVAVAGSRSVWWWARGWVPMSPSGSPHKTCRKSSPCFWYSWRYTSGLRLGELVKNSELLGLFLLPKED